MQRERAERRRADNLQNITAGLLANLVATGGLLVADAIGLADIGVVRGLGVAMLGTASFALFAILNGARRTPDDAFMSRFFWATLSAQLLVFFYGSVVANEIRPVALLLSMLMVGLLFVRSTSTNALLYSAAASTLFAGASVIGPRLLGQPDRLIEDLFYLAVWACTAAIMSFLVGRQRNTRDRLRAQRTEIASLNRELREVVLRRFLPPSLVDAVVDGRASLDDRPTTRTLTVLLVDIVGFTAIADRMRAAGISEFLGQYYSLMCEVVFEHQGIVDKFMGDGVMVLFGVARDLPPPDQAAAAVACARSMHRRIADAREAWRPAVGTDTQIRVAIHQGPAAVGYFGTALRTELTAVGPTINLAFRMAEICAPGTAMVSSSVADHLPPGDVESRGVFSLRGIVEPRHLFVLRDTSATQLHRTPSPTATVRAISSGDVHDGYRILRQIGYGGVGAVYEARHEETGEVCALKVLHETSDEQRQRLLQEAEVQRMLSPAHVVPVLDVVDIAQRPALVMPLVRGTTLASLLTRYHPSEDEVAAMAEGIVQAMVEAHAKGIVHRDLKPQNVLLDVTSGSVVPRVTDFGLARLESVSLGTRTGMFFGTPQYAAPEQYEDASRVSDRADIWALGVILYEMLTGTTPFRARDVEAMRLAVATADYPTEPLPERWRPLIHKALAPIPEGRPSALALLRIVARLQRDLSVLGPQSSLRQRLQELRTDQ